MPESLFHTINWTQIIFVEHIVDSRFSKIWTLIFSLFLLQQKWEPLSKKTGVPLIDRSRRLISLVKFQILSLIKIFNLHVKIRDKKTTVHIYLLVFKLTRLLTRYQTGFLKHGHDMLSRVRSKTGKHSQTTDGFSHFKIYRLLSDKFNLNEHACSMLHAPTWLYRPT